jgi:hypothetical protein
MVTQDAEEAMKKLEKKCSLVVPPKLFPNCSSSHQNWEQVGNGSARKALPLEAVRENLAERGGGLKPQVSRKPRFTREIAAIAFSTASFQT